MICGIVKAPFVGQSIEIRRAQQPACMSRARKLDLRASSMSTISLDE
jgi:hypothetical protein